MKKIILFVLLAAFLLSSVFARAQQDDRYTKERRRPFVLEKTEYLDDMYKFLFCVLTFGDTETRNAYELSRRCKNPHLQNQILMDRNPTEQMVFSSIKGYEFAVQTLILCSAEFGSRSHRNTDTAGIISYCDRVISPVD